MDPCLRRPTTRTGSEGDRSLSISKRTGGNFPARDSFFSYRELRWSRQLSILA